MTKTYILNERPGLSGCVASPMGRLESLAPEGYTITPADVFADIAKHGSGASGALLRKHNVGPDEIDAILRTQNLAVMGAEK